MPNPRSSRCHECHEVFFYPAGSGKRVKCDNCKDELVRTTRKEINSTCIHCGTAFSYWVKPKHVGRPRSICPECVRSRRSERKHNEQKRLARRTKLVLVPPERSIEEMKRTRLTADERLWLRHQRSVHAKSQAIREDKLGRMYGT